MNEKFRGNKLFDGLEPATVTSLLELVEEKTFQPSEVIICEGDPGNCLFLVAEGSVRISKKGRADQQETLAIILPDDFFGEMSLLDLEPRSATATAEQRTVVGCINQTGLDRVFSVAPEIVPMNFTRAVVNRLRKADTLLIDEVMRAERMSLVGMMANSMVHDFVNPISQIISANDFLYHTCEDPRCIRKTEVIQKAVDRMMGMTRELLDYSRGKTNVRRERVSMDQLVNELDELILKTLSQSGFHVLKQIHYRGEVTIDLHRVIRMLVNIINNSVDAMKPGGTLMFRTKVENAELVMEVEDTGSGIPYELQPKIFQPFVSFGKPHGTGLGLAVAKSVVEAHGGKIFVESEPNRGTKFQIRLPLHPKDAGTLESTPAV